MLLGLIGAMPEEMEKIISAINLKNVVERGSRTYYCGLIEDQEVVAVFSRWGKVAAATTTANLILDFKVDRIVFTGIAGGISSNVSIGDIILGSRLFQHDMDARPLLNRFEIPLTGKSFFELNLSDVQLMQRAVQNFLDSNTAFRKMLNNQRITKPQIFIGEIASGDLFISSKKMKQALLKNLPSVLCAEMEGAAVAQVCHDYNVPLVVVRVISDSADEKAHDSVSEFVIHHAGEYSLGIIREYIRLLLLQ